MTVVKLPSISYPSITLPAVLTIAGSDSSGGAGIEADLKTLTVNGVYGLTCITALTAQNTQGVEAIRSTPKELLHQILKRNFDDFLIGYSPGEQPLKVIKTGMLTVEAVSELVQHLPILSKYEIKMVVDPVMVSTSGANLFDGAELAIGLMKEAYLLTPNLQEAQILFEAVHKEVPSISSRVDFILFVRDLKLALGCSNLLVKGGHIPWDKNLDKPVIGSSSNTNARILDILYDSNDDITVFESDYIDNPNTHGTGCTLASAIAANLAKLIKLHEAIFQAIDYVHHSMHGSKKIGWGKHGPLNHMAIRIGEIDRTLQNSPQVIASDILVENSHRITNNMVVENVPEISKSPVAAKNYLNFFINHKNVNPEWKKYINHKFVSAVAADRLSFKRFLYFIKQDYYYLINYAQIHALAASVAPTYSQILSESLSIASVVKEIENHKLKLAKEYGIDFDRDVKFDKELQAGPACIEYCEYLLEVGKREDYVGIKVALAPCLFGYNEACKWGQLLRIKREAIETENADITKAYLSWLDDYTGEWYTDACATGLISFNELFDSVSPERMEELVEIFKKVTELEVSFWDEVISE